MSAATVWTTPVPGALRYAITETPDGWRAGIVEHTDDHLTLIGWDGDAEVSWHHVDPADRSLILLRPRGVGLRVSVMPWRDLGTVLGWDELRGLVVVQWQAGTITFHPAHTLIVDPS